MSAHRAREPRKPVRIGARLKGGQGWRDVVIRNVSARGVMGECGTAPARGDYVELRCGAYVIVARVAWAHGGHFGAQAQDLIALPDLIAGNNGRVAERRRKPRPLAADVRARPVAERAEASARLGRAFEFLSLIAVGAALASLLGAAAHNALARPAATVSQALAAGGAR